MMKFWSVSSAKEATYFYWVCIWHLFFFCFLFLSWMSLNICSDGSIWLPIFEWSCSWFGYSKGGFVWVADYRPVETWNVANDSRLMCHELVWLLFLLSQWKVPQWGFCPAVSHCPTQVYLPAVSSCGPASCATIPSQADPSWDSTTWASSLSFADEI